MLTIDCIRKRLEDRNLKLVAKRTGLSYYIVRRAREGADISYKAVKSLSDYLAA
ncbi:hypothetical protein [Sphingobium sp. EP60837]|uniref:hypothetical protein n=1 Tax=Sphingobium sp. EP60837 TaxID=1855519 RepID=UPI0007DD33ED|nr:hypothetical protein [Sphingobium sp. EP60837]ANI79026.1 hypothetical protein EP837_02631 [Sphingobium sp. EP60837]